MVSSVHFYIALAGLELLNKIFIPKEMKDIEKIKLLVLSTWHTQQLQRLEDVLTNGKKLRDVNNLL